MIRYSLQRECLENIEAFSDEHINREMAVIESVIDIFDKTVLMMELSNNDVDVPDCSMFMESAFFQEMNETPTENAQSQAGGDPPVENIEKTEQNNAQTTGDNNTQQTNNNNEQKKPPTEAERKKYNSEHQFRQMNKKGNIEHMFISIITFIPRFFGFLIQCGVKFFKKLFNTNADESVEKADTSMQNLTKEEVLNAINDAEKSQNDNNNNNNNNQTQSNTPPQNANNTQPQQEQADNMGTLDINSMNWKWYNTNNVVAGIRKCMMTLTNILNNIDSMLTDNTTLDLKKQIDDCQSIIKNSISSNDGIMMSGKDVVKSKDMIKDQLDRFGKLCGDLKNAFESRKDKFLKIFEKNNDKNARINELKQSCVALRNFSKTTSESLDKVYKSYSKLVTKAIAINNAADSKNNNGNVNNGGENNGNVSGTQNNQPTTQ